MDLLIITGMSGAGKSRAIEALEDMGFYCIDNLPPNLLSTFAVLPGRSGDTIRRLAVTVDSRGGQLVETLPGQLEDCRKKNIPYRVLFLDCDNATLMHRYKETRRKHPLVSRQHPSVEQAIVRDRELLRQARNIADYVVDTTHLTSAQLRSKLMDMFAGNKQNGMLINCMSFGFKNGSPAEADLMFDVRCLPNPFYIKELKLLTGIDAPVSEYVMSWEQSRTLYSKIEDLIDYLVPLYVHEGKSQLVVAFGCAGGHHRSVTFAEKLYKHLLEKGYNVVVNHRDIAK